MAAATFEGFPYITCSASPGYRFSLGFCFAYSFNLHLLSQGMSRTLDFNLICNYESLCIHSVIFLLVYIYFQQRIVF